MRLKLVFRTRSRLDLFSAMFIITSRIRLSEEIDITIRLSVIIIVIITQPDGNLRILNYFAYNLPLETNRT